MIVIVIVHAEPEKANTNIFTKYLKHAFKVSSLNSDFYIIIVRHDSRVINSLQIDRVTRDDLDTMFSCQASNNNVSLPLSASVTIDILGKSLYRGYLIPCIINQRLTIEFE